MALGRQTSLDDDICVCIVLRNVYAKKWLKEYNNPRALMNYFFCEATDARSNETTTAVGTLSTRLAVLTMAVFQYDSKMQPNN